MTEPERKILVYLGKITRTPGFAHVADWPAGTDELLASMQTRGLVEHRACPKQWPASRTWVPRWWRITDAGRRRYLEAG